MQAAGVWRIFDLLFKILLGIWFLGFGISPWRPGIWDFRFTLV
jgi:hypothetical protein